MSNPHLLSLAPYGMIALLTIACSRNQPETADNELHVPEGYTVELAAGPELLDYPMFATLDETGRLFVFESVGNVYEKSQEAIDDPQFRIKLLQDTDGDGRYDRSTIFADKLSFPQGGVFYRGSLYASSAPDLLKLTDTDGDGVADEREVLLSGWILNVNANSLIGPFLGPDGRLYLTNAIMGFDVATREGERLKGETARIWRVRPDGSQLEWVSAGGMNNPVELAFTPAGEVIGTQTFFVDPQRGLRDALTFWVEGGVYGKKNANITRDKLPLTGDLMPVITTYSRVAPAGLGVYRSDALGADFRDNLFSAQFNTHTVVRHRLFRDGASFRTEDEPFFWADNEDFHPTDVLEDADGSLLVVETGGWFILGCPLSQVSKPQLKGGIYRIRRTGPAAVEDPYGNGIDWPTLPPAELARLLADARPFVADRAGEALVDRGAEAIEVLRQTAAQATSEAVRTRTVFLLHRIGTVEAQTVVRSALKDKDLQVRVAAARAAGLAADQAAVEPLLEMLQSDEPAGRRQAATALGQINDARALPALIETAATADDRFVRHAVIYALLVSRRPDLILPALRHPSAPAQAAALIALDQMPGSPLRAEQVVPLLNDAEPSLRQTALWATSHHPEWAPALTAYLEGKLNASVLNEAEKPLLSAILAGFCGQAEMQTFIARQLKTGADDTRLFLLDNMSDCGEKAFPEAWISILGELLTGASDPTIKLRAVQLARLRNLGALSGALAQAADDDGNPAVLRIAAIDALLGANPAPADRHFAYLLDQLRGGAEAPLLQQTTAVLTAAELSDAQLEQIARDYLPQADPFFLPRLAPVFEGAEQPAIGQALARALIDSPSLDSFTEERIQALFSAYPAELQPLIEELLSKLRQVHGERLQRLEEVQKQLAGGSIERGRALYFGKAICWTCHTMGEEGGRLGPDLTAIQRDRSVHDILEAILYPSVSFVREYETFEVTTQSGKHAGIIQDQTPEVIVLGTGPEASVRLLRSEILQMTPVSQSLMPQGLDQLLTEQEFADLVAFLLGQDLVY